MTACFHCGLEIPRGAHFSFAWEGEARALCCGGCQAVAQAIVGAGLGDYYRRRSAPARTAEDIVPPQLHELEAYDHPAVQRAFVRAVGDARDATLILEGITCPACVWLNERQLRRLPGVTSVRVNYATRRAQVAWDDARVQLSDILKAVQRIGYRAYPYDPARSQQILALERRRLLRRLGVAAVFGAQIMTLAVALYVGDWSGSDPDLRRFFYWISAVLTLPIIFYAAQPFFRSAVNDLRCGRTGMDVPIALGITVAFGASAWTALTGKGTIYFDSIAMFVFFLLGARYLELSARFRSAAAAENLTPASPAVANRLDTHGSALAIPIAELQPGDAVLVRPGETVPTDGTVVGGQSSVSEALLTGESLPIPKHIGSAVIGGSINVESPLTVRVEKVGADTVLADLRRLLDRAQTDKPPAALVADRVAAWFVGGVLVLTVLVAAYWWVHDSARTVPVVIAVLVVTCPCALGLATPAALTAATNALARIGMLTTRAHALESLARVDYFVFDKTGTLTLGEPRLRDIRALTGDIDADRCLAVAAALEKHSEHPIARAIVAAAKSETLATNVVNCPGEGLHGIVDGEVYHLGSLRYIERSGGMTCDEARVAELAGAAMPVIWLAHGTRLLAAFVLEDSLRPGAEELIARLRHDGTVALLSGDRAAPVAHVARTLGIENARAELLPAQKLDHVRQLQADGHAVAVLGDGINDAPVLAAADVSIAVGSGAALSTSAADMILLGRDLRPVGEAATTARKTVAIVRQNIAWAIAYNLLALPAAATGYVSPWIAALGMSASSSLVVANALRLIRTKPRTREIGGTQTGNHRLSISRGRLSR